MLKGLTCIILYTLGLSFWKSPQRKLYAVPKEDLNAVLGIDYCETGDRDMVGDIKIIKLK